MRVAAIEAVAALAERDPRVVLLVADLGHTVVERFAERFPDRFWNVGAAEQSLVGVATGLAEGGFVPFLYTIAPFAALRPLELLRDGPAAHGLPVRMLGVGCGFGYGTAGFTHFGVDDVGAMRLLPGMAVFAPAGDGQARAAVAATAGIPGPVYVRLAKDPVADVHGLDRFRPGRLDVVREGSDVVFLALGPLVREALAAADLLRARGVDAGAAVCASIEPAPREDLARLLGDARLVVTVEDHVAAGGLGSLVAESIAENGLGCRLFRRAVDPGRLSPVGSARWMHVRHGLDAPSLVARASEALHRLSLAEPTIPS
jgi:transketolase